MLRSLLLATAFLLLAIPSHAQRQPCAPANQLLAHLHERFGERPVWEGIIAMPDGVRETILTQSRKGSWSFIVKHGETACISAAGNQGTEIITGQGV